MTYFNNQLPNLENKSLPLVKKESPESSSEKGKLYLKIEKSNHYLYDICDSKKGEIFEILSKNSINEKLNKIHPNILNKILTLHIPNIGYLAQYKLLQKLNISVLDINEGKIFDELPGVIMPKKESIKSENLNEKEKDDENTGKLFDVFFQNIEDSEKAEKKELIKELKNDESKEKTKPETQKEIKIDENKITQISFSENIIKFFTSKEINDTLIINYEELKNSENLENIIELLTNNDYCIEGPSPKFFENNWYIPLPEWVYSIKSFDPFNLTLTIILLIIILIISQDSNNNSTTKTNLIDDKDDLDVIFEQNKKKIDELKEDEKIIESIFSEKIVTHISKQITKFYNQNCNLNEENKIDYFDNQLTELQKYISKYETSQEQLEKLFEKITFYTSSDILNSYHYTFICFRKFLLNCSSYMYLTKIMNKVLKKISNDNDIIKPHKDKIVSLIKNIISNKLEKYYSIKYIEYGSSAIGLDIKSSDRDILISFEIKDKSKNIDSGEFCEIVAALLEKNIKLPDLNIKVIHPENHIKELIKLKYKRNEKIIQIDITFTKNKEYVENLEEMIKLEKKDLEKYPNLRPLILIIKSILKYERLNNVYYGGLNSSSVFF